MHVHAEPAGSLGCGLQLLLRGLIRLAGSHQRCNGIGAPALVAMSHRSVSPNPSIERMPSRLRRLVPAHVKR